MQKAYILKFYYSFLLQSFKHLNIHITFIDNFLVIHWDANGHIGACQGKKKSMFKQIYLKMKTWNRD